MNVNEWFAYTSAGTIIDQIVDMFKQDIDVISFEFEHKSTDVIKHKLSTALCYLYTLHLQNKPLILGFPKKHVFPLGWDTPIEDEWIEFLESKYFDYLYWERFWECIPHNEIDETLYNWREQIQLLIPLYIKRDSKKLNEHENDSSDSETGSTENESVYSYPNK